MTTKLSLMYFALTLKNAREAKGLTQAELGELSGLSQTWISHYESGRRLPSLGKLVKLADALDASTDHLLSR
jgi:transcriptional regulator with XRE-family HTH domain